MRRLIMAADGMWIMMLVLLLAIAAVTIEKEKR